MASSDGRISCPQCGGLVHPVAGKCKHCKEDLAARRVGRASAPTALPAIQTASTAQTVIGSVPQMIHNIAPNPIQYTPGQYTPGTIGSPVLPPRQTGRSIAVQSPRSWKSWPMLVIVLASIAIVVAVVMMVWPPGATDAGKHVVQPPAPERMQTDPLPPAGAGNSNGADPWGGHSQADPPKQPQAPAPSAIDPDPTPAPSAPDPQAANGGPQDPIAFLSAATTHACTRLQSCPNADTTISLACQMLPRVLPQRSAPTCAAAQRCFAAIDKMDCDTQDVEDAVISITDCMTAATSC